MSVRYWTVYGGVAVGGTGRCTAVWARRWCTEPSVHHRLRLWRRGHPWSCGAVMRLREQHRDHGCQPETSRHNQEGSISNGYTKESSAGLRLVLSGRLWLAQAHHHSLCRPTAPPPQPQVFGVSGRNTKPCLLRVSVRQVYSRDGLRTSDYVLGTTALRPLYLGLLPSVPTA